MDVARTSSSIGIDCNAKVRAWLRQARVPAAESVAVGGQTASAVHTSTGLPLCVLARLRSAPPQHHAVAVEPETAAPAPASIQIFSLKPIPPLANPSRESSKLCRTRAMSSPANATAG